MLCHPFLSVCLSVCPSRNLFYLIITDQNQQSIIHAQPFWHFLIPLPLDIFLRFEVETEFSSSFTASIFPFLQPFLHLEVNLIFQVHISQSSHLSRSTNSDWFDWIIRRQFFLISCKICFQVFLFHQSLSYFFIFAFWHFDSAALN